MSSREKDSYNIKSVENALLLLETLAEEDNDYSLASLSQKLHITKASLFRLMATFETHGYVEHCRISGEYRIGMAAYEVSQKLLSHMSLLREAKAVMAQLVRSCEETIYLLVQRQQDALFLDSADSIQKVKIVPLTGQRFALDSCAAGQIFLAYDDKNRDYLVQRPELKQTVELCRRRHFALDHNGIGEGSTCIAVPLFQRGKKLAGSLALLAPTFRADEQRIDKELLPALKAAGETISARIGYNAYAPKNTG